jgi:hypothetical protein
MKNRTTYETTEAAEKDSVSSKRLSKKCDKRIKGCMSEAGKGKGLLISLGRSIAGRGEEVKD